ncbi:hypothetical protein V2J09_024156, partial [Rumex salicifolius]
TLGGIASFSIPIFNQRSRQEISFSFLLAPPDSYQHLVQIRYLKNRGILLFQRIKDAPFFNSSLTQLLLQAYNVQTIKMQDCKRPNELLSDPETLLLQSEEVGGGEWELYKENVRPLKRGRNVKILNEALKSHSNIQLKKSLLQTRRKLIEGIDEYKGDDPLKPWLECIKWVQEAFPAGGDSSGLILIYEQCVRAFWHEPRYKDDIRFLKVWLEYAENCDDAEVIYKFLDSNGIGQTHSAFYIAYALQMEAKHRVKTADEMFNRGLSINAHPREKLEAAYRKFLARTMRSSGVNADEESKEENLPTRNFGTVISRVGNRREDLDRSNVMGKNNRSGGERVALSIYKDENVQNADHAGFLSADTKAWHNLASQKDRNKENKAIPSKWTSHKIPQKVANRGIVAPYIEVFVDDECSMEHPSSEGTQNSFNIKAKEGEEQVLKRESERLRQNPLLNFPACSLPR